MSGINIPVTVTGADTAATQLGKVSTSLGGIKNASNTAGQSLTNLGRIAQDAPFGFIGIQNNINPLVESFGRLKAETGSTGGAFKALVGSLAGAGGIGLAVSVVTGALTVLSQQGFFKTAQAADEAAKKAKEFQKEVDSIGRSAASEQANVLILVGALESETTSRQKKADALKQLQQINPQYFGDLKLEGDLVKGIGQAYESYAASILASVQNKIDTKRLEDVLVKLNEAEEKQKRNQLQIAANEAEKNRLIALGGKQYARSFDLQNQQLSQNFQLVDLARQRDEILKRISEREFAGVIKGSNATKEAEKATKSTIKAVETIDSTIAALRAKLDVLGKEEILFNVDKSKEKIKELEGTISTLFSKFKLQPDTPIIQQLKSEIDAINQQIIRDENIRIIARIQTESVSDRKDTILNEITKGNERLSKLVKPIKLPVAVVDPFAEQRKNVEEFAKQASEVLTTAFSDSFVALGEFLGKALTGDAGVGGFLIGIANILGGALKELGKYIIVASKLIAGIKNALNAAFKGNPILGVIAGIALIALGTAIQNSLPKFANGVENFGGGLALVGERGPEIVRLPSGSDVIPNYRLNSLTAPAAMTYIPNVTLRGSDLVIAFNRQTATNRRNG